MAGLRQAEADAAQAGVSDAARRLREPARVERRVHERPRELPLVDVEGPDRHRPRRHALDHLPVDVVLLVLRRHVGRAAHQQELRSVQADAFGARRQRRGHIVGPLDVGLQLDADAVARRRAARPQSARRRQRAARPGARAPRLPAASAGDGSMITSPVSPSMMTDAPGGMRRLTSCRPTTAGTPSERARIAVWYVRLPASVAKPRMRVQSSCATTDGVSSSAISTHGVSRSCEQVARRRPSRRACSCAAGRRRRAGRPSARAGTDPRRR